ncbi:MraY family glycosyltransferase [Neomicrococcus aestuarii]|uniref:Undecaprenyl-phosphate alpha-N-acetylglucosaminyl 1-phosphate transferase n=1 Tax=Neomicrococcus aestuarii TaxID=556325 RepID=A0A1L2ZLF2_9MICC|nr:MraY family glycosyltransferase [Neomicrococcus aestuarii]APF39861.1 undecaprenyl-phosphate alpha-N-acetylglucosaminyl 1-phosphate transferase [Neomicrococcus aestuarii]
MKLYLLLIATSCVIAFLLTPVMRAVGSRFVVPAALRERDVHQRPIPKLGGVAMIIAVLIGLALSSQMPFFQGVFANPLPLNGIFLACLIVLVVGVIDDIFDLRWYAKMAGQALAGLVIALNGIRLEAMPVGWIHIQSESLQIGLTVFVVVLTMNAINFVDGLDGLAAGVAAIGAAAFFIYSYVLARTINEFDHSNLSALLMALLLGASLGFLIHNFYPATIFMGESGAMLIGLIMSTAALAVTADVGALGAFRFRNVPSYMPILLPIAVILLPLVDLGAAVVRRTASGRSPFSADRGHLHHKLIDGGWTQRQAVLLLYLWSALVAFGTVAFNFVHYGILIPVLVVLFLITAYITSNPWQRRRLRRARAGESPVKVFEGETTPRPGKEH